MVYIILWSVLTLILLLSILMSGACTAKQKISIALTHIPNVLEYQNDKAPYNRLVEKLLQDNDFDVSVAYMPSSRSNKKLVEQSIDCIFPIVPTNMRPIATQLSHRINAISAHVFSLGPEVYTELKQLNQKLVVHQRGYLFGDYITNNNDINFFPVVNLQAAIGMLRKKRAAALIDYMPDLRFILSESEMSQLKYDENNPLIRSFDHFECIVEPRIDKFIQALNKKIDKLKASGELEILLGKYYTATE